MRAVLQRVTRAAVSVDQQVVGSITGPGLVALVAASHEDTPVQAEAMAAKIAGLRILAGERSVADLAGSVLLISQFTLYGDTRKGRRPSWGAAAPAPIAKPLIDAVATELGRRGVTVATGRFGAMMSVELVNDGPVTVIVDV